MKNLFFVLAFVLISSSSFAQVSMAGRVLDVEGDPVIGANVFVLKTNKGAVTDENGRYEIRDMERGEYTARISHVAYRTLTRKIAIPETTQRYVVNVQMIDASLELDALIVKATRAGEKTPITYTNLTKEDIEANNLGQDVPYLLKWSPSAVVTSDAGTGIGYTGLRIRGSDPSRVNVTINGIPLNDPESQFVFWVDLPDFVSSTNDIQIQRGVGTSTNGGGAFGGSVNLNTNKITKKAYGSLNNSIGSFNTLKSNVTFGTGLIDNKFSFDGRLSNIQSDGYIDRGSSDLQSFYLSGAYLGKKSSLRLNVFSGHEITYQAWNGVPAQYVDDDVLRRTNTAGTDKPGEPNENEVDDYVQSHVQAFFNHQANRNLNLNLAVHYTKGAGFFEQYKGGQTLTDYGIAPIENSVTVGDSVFTNTIEESDLIVHRKLDNDFYGATFSVDYTSDSRKLALVFGGAYSYYDARHFGEVVWSRFAGDSELGDLYYDNDADKIDFNFYGKANYQLTNSLNGYLDLQYRRVDYTFLGFDNNGQSVEQNDKLNFFNPKAGLFYDLNERSNFYLSFGVANREPNRNDYTESTPASRPVHETLYNTEFGYKQSFNKAVFSANVYHMFYKNQLVLNGQINDVGEFTRINIDESYRLGLELVGGVELSKGLDFNASATFSQNRIPEFTEYIDNWDTWGQDPIAHKNTDLAFSPNVITSGELQYDFLKDKNGQSFKVALLGKYVGKQFIDNTSNENTILDPYFFSDLRLNFNFKTKFFKEVGMTFLVRNLFDSKFSTNAWTYRYRSPSYDGRGDDPFTRLEGGDVYNLTGFYPQAGRNFLFGLSLKF